MVDTSGQVVDWASVFSGELDDKLGTLPEQACNIERYLAVSCQRAAEKSFTIGFEAGWGHGKTFLMNGLAAGLKNSGYAVVHFNAWERSYAEDPLQALVSELARVAEENGIKLKKSFSEIINGLMNAKEAGAIIGIMFEIGTQIPGLRGLISKTWDSTKSSSEGTIKNLKKTAVLSDYELEKLRHNAIKQLCQYMVSELWQAKGEKPVLFIIDELDRCAPDYALQVLERIRHIMGDKQAVFMLAYDRQQLIAFIEKEQGAIDRGGEYLERFIDLPWPLLRPEAQTFVPFLWQEEDIMGKLPELYRQPTLVFLIDDLREVMIKNCSDLPLRTQKRLMNKYGILLSTAEAMFDESWPQQVFGPLLVWSVLFARTVTEEKRLTVESLAATTYGIKPEQYALTRLIKSDYPENYLVFAFEIFRSTQLKKKDGYDDFLVNKNLNDFNEELRITIERLSNTEREILRPYNDKLMSILKSDPYKAHSDFFISHNFEYIETIIDSVFSPGSQEGAMPAD